MSTSVEKAKDKSLLDGIIERFNNELIEMERRSNSILDKVCMLKDARSPRPRNEEVNEEPPGIITELDNHLDKMNDLNDILRQINDGLTTSVG